MRILEDLIADAMGQFIWWLSIRRIRLNWSGDMFWIVEKKSPICISPSQIKIINLSNIFPSTNAIRYSVAMPMKSKNFSTFLFGCPLEAEPRDTRENEPRACYPSVREESWRTKCVYSRARAIRNPLPGDVACARDAPNHFLAHWSRTRCLLLTYFKLRFSVCRAISLKL